MPIGLVIGGNMAFQGISEKIDELIVQETRIFTQTAWNGSGPKRKRPEGCRLQKHDITYFATSPPISPI